MRIGSQNLFFRSLSPMKAKVFFNIGLLYSSTILSMVPSTQQVLITYPIIWMKWVNMSKKHLCGPPMIKKRLLVSLYMVNRGQGCPWQSLAGGKGLKGEWEVAVFLSFSLLGLIYFYKSSISLCVFDITQLYFEMSFSILQVSGLSGKTFADINLCFYNVHLRDHHFYDRTWLVT